MNYHLKGHVKEVDDSGSFVVRASTADLDRDGEIIDVGAFKDAGGRLPDSIPIHWMHKFDLPVGRGVPTYEGDALIVRGKFSTTPLAQEVRTLVTDGTVRHCSVGFHDPVYDRKGTIPRITKAELLEVSFCSISSNRQAEVLAARAYNPRRHDTDSDLVLLKARIAICEAALALDNTPRRPASPQSTKSILAELGELQSFLAELAAPAARGPQQETKAAAPSRLPTNLWDVWNNQREDR